MKGKFKRISLLLVALMSTIALCEYAQAEEICTTHKNYYYFVVINKSKTAYFDTDPDVSKSMTTHTYFPFPEGYKKGTAKSISICIKRDKNDTSCTEGGKQPDDIWTLEEFYSNYKNVTTNGTPKTHGASGNSTSTSKELLVASTGIRHYTHGQWLEENGDIGGTGVNIGDSNIQSMIGASVLPETVTIITDLDNSLANNHDYIFATIQRSFKESYANNSSVGTFRVAWSNGTEYDSILSPSVYGIEYQTCEEKEEPTPEEPTSKKYNITINYLSKEDNKKVADSDYINDVEETFSTTVTPPTVKNCNPDKKTVDVSIKDTNGEAKDRTYNVYYTCKTDASVDTNAKTGDGLIYASIILAFTAIGLGTYYFVVYGKAKKEEA